MHRYRVLVATPVRHHYLHVGVITYYRVSRRCLHLRHYAAVVSRPHSVHKVRHRISTIADIIGHGVCHWAFESWQFAVRCFKADVIGVPTSVGVRHYNLHRIATAAAVAGYGCICLVTLVCTAPGVCIWPTSARNVRGHRIVHASRQRTLASLRRCHKRHRWIGQRRHSKHHRTVAPVNGMQVERVGTGSFVMSAVPIKRICILAHTSIYRRNQFRLYCKPQRHYAVAASRRCQSVVDHRVLHIGLSRQRPGIACARLLVHCVVFRRRNRNHQRVHILATMVCNTPVYVRSRFFVCQPCACPHKRVTHRAFHLCVIHRTCTWLNANLRVRPHRRHRLLPRITSYRRGTHVIRVAVGIYHLVA